MSIREALQLCPALIIKAPNMSLYQKLSHQLHEFLSLRIPLIDQASMDDSYGDLSGGIDDGRCPALIDNLRLELKKSLNFPVSYGWRQKQAISAKFGNKNTAKGHLACKTHSFDWNLDLLVDPFKRLENFRWYRQGFERQNFHQGYRFKTTLGELRLKDVALWNLGDLLQKNFTNG